MSLSPVGRIVEEEWARMPAIWPGVEIDEFVVMPNHVHGIVVLSGAPSLSETPVETHLRGVSTREDFPGPSLGDVIRRFKGDAARRIWASGGREFGWQERFYDRIVRGERSLNAIREYIRDNPRKWAMDGENPANRQARGISGRTLR
jgi:REP element-mobilizing transposase RayT